LHYDNDYDNDYEIVSENTDLRFDRLCSLCADRSELRTGECATGAPVDP
jgi:hypothetical protein